MKLLEASLILAGFIVVGTIAYAQSVSVSGPSGVTQAQMTAAMTTLQAMIPTPLGSVPIQPSGAGVVGVANTYVPGDAAMAQKVQRTTVTTDASGNFAVTWNWSFVSSTPVVNAIPLDNTGTFYACKVKTRSATGMTGTCQQIASQAVALISLTIALAPAAAPSGISVMVIGAEPTQ